MVEQLKSKYQMEVAVDNGMLDIRQHGQSISVGSALKAFTEREPAHFIVPGGQVRSAADLLPANTPEGTKQRSELIASQGFGKFREIISAPNLRPGVIASREMSREDWNNLTRQEKIAAIKADPEIVSIVMARKGAAR